MDKDFAYYKSTGDYKSGKCLIYTRIKLVLSSIKYYLKYWNFRWKIQFYELFIYIDTSYQNFRPIF